jgi:hypothetical protein
MVPQNELHSFGNEEMNKKEMRLGKWTEVEKEKIRRMCFMLYILLPDIQ